MLQKTVRFVVLTENTLESSLESMMNELRFLDQNESIETTLLIFPHQYADFESYLDLVDLSEALLEEQGYEGIYQVASFHPDYCFSGSEETDPANYTNRSPYPMLHLLREDSVTRVLEHYEDPEGIPERNIAFAKKKGLAAMKLLREACMEVGN